MVVSTKPWYAQRSRGQVARSRGAADGNAQPSEEGPQSPLDVVYPTTFYPGATDSSGAVPLVVKPGERATADVGLAAVPAIHLRIKGVHTDSAEGYSATLVQRLFDGISIPVVDGGSRVVNGNEVEITGAPPGQYEMKVQSYGKSQSSWEQTVNVANDADLTAGEPSPSAEVSGVALVDGVPAPEGTFIQLLDQSTGAGVAEKVGGKGEFRFDQGTKPGIYEVLAGEAQGNGQGTVRSLAASGAKVVGRKVVISGGGPVRLTVELSKRLGRVDGVALRQGKPQGGVMIVLVPNDPNDRDLENSGSLFRRDQSDSDGTFTLRDVVPGKYIVLALANGWDMEWMKASALKPFLAGGESVEVRGEGKLQVKVRVQ